MKKEINETQEIIFRLIEKATFNQMDGYQIVSDLKRNRNLWYVVHISREFIPLIILRDLIFDTYHADCIYILTDKKKLKKLLPIIKKWRYDTINLIDNNNCIDNLIGGGFTWIKEEFKLPLSTQFVLIKLWWD